MAGTLVEKYEEKLKSVNNSYSEFVAYFMTAFKNHEDKMQQVIAFINENPDATPGKVIRYGKTELNINDYLEDAPVDEYDDEYEDEDFEYDE